MSKLVKHIQKVLIANRGEIAIRIQKACQALSRKTATVCSEADKNALFAKLAEELHVIGPAAAAESYLHIEKIVQAALDADCDAVHPGYGFLSENANFAQRVIESGLIFIGPDPESIRVLGSKTEARKLAEKAGLPLPRGVEGGLDDTALIDRAQKIGFPLMIKAVAGGGGRGMRVVEDAEDLREGLPLARAEAKKYFSDDNVYVEKKILDPRHVEVQVMGDSYGNVIHLGTRDCSTQRRNQKLVEEAPAPDLSDDLRERIQHAAVKIAKASGYKNAGTVEFLVKNNEFFFLEMNTRIQVEHPVTELVTGIDLVKLQIEVAEDRELPIRQNQVAFQGHAIEYRIYAEDPQQNFRPSLGTISHQHYPEEDFLRLDNGFERGSAVTPYYDAMLSKVIVFGETRSRAISNSFSILSDIQIDGIETNIKFHQWLLERTPFSSSPVDIGYLERSFTEDTIKDYINSRNKDPYHCSSLGELQKIEHFQFKPMDSTSTFTIELTHLSDGTFLAAPIDESGYPAKEEHCRRSNGHVTALDSLKEEVLSKLQAKQIFSP